MLKTIRAKKGEGLVLDNYKINQKGIELLEKMGWTVEVLNGAVTIGSAKGPIH